MLTFIFAFFKGISLKQVVALLALVALIGAGWGGYTVFHRFVDQKVQITRLERSLIDKDLLIAAKEFEIKQIEHAALIAAEAAREIEDRAKDYAEIIRKLGQGRNTDADGPMAPVLRDTLDGLNKMEPEK